MIVKVEDNDKIIYNVNKILEIIKKNEDKENVSEESKKKKE